MNGGTDQVTGLSGNNSITTTGPGADTINLTSGNNTVVVGDGSDVINAGDGLNTVSAGNGNDAITLGNGFDTVTTLDETARSSSAVAPQTSSPWAPASTPSC